MTDLVSHSWDAVLPCPFCNGRGKLLISESLHKGSGECSSACVACDSCGAGGPVFEPRNAIVNIEAGARIAIARWNRRGQHQNADWKLQRIAQILNSEYAKPLAETKAPASVPFCPPQPEDTV